MNEQFKRVNNPLFSAAVTGATLEDFSQNAILLPAKEKSPPATLSQDQILDDIFSDKKSAFHDQLNQEDIVVKPPDTNIPQTSDQSSNPPQQSQGVFSLVSKFTSNFSIGFSNNNGQKVNEPPLVTNLEDNNNPPQVPLFSSGSVFPPIPTIPSATCTAAPPLLDQENRFVSHPRETNPQSVPLFPPSAAFPSVTSTPCSIIPPPLTNQFQSNTQSIDSNIPQSLPLFPSDPSLLSVRPVTSTSSSSSSTVLPSSTNQEQINSQSVHNIPQSVPLFSTNDLFPTAPANTSTLPLPLTSQEQNNSQSVLLGAGSKLISTAESKPPGNTSSSINVFRRSGLKRPTYAPVPGLSNFPQPHLQPLTVPQQNELIPQTAPLVPENTSTAAPPTTNYSSQNYFKPIRVPPPTVNLGTQISQPLPTYLPRTTTPSQTFQSPVMDAIPDSEVMKSNIPGTGPSRYVNNDNSANVNTAVPQVYRPVYHHWFYKKEIEGKPIWQPFSMIDSLALENAFTSNDIDPEKFIATDGDRYDVNILRRQRTPVYWNGNTTEVRRCSWFHKNSDGRLVPYEENVANLLEEEFKLAFETNQWHKKVELASKETVVFHAPDVLVLFPPEQSPDAWGNTPNQTRPRVVKRGMDEFDIDEGEPSHVDHILFLVHGIGSVCDLKFRTVEEVVDEFRNIAFQLVQSHYKSSCEREKVHRVEVLPISWHDKLHSEETGIDNQLKAITLESIPKLRDFTNNTLLDILFYTSPVYSQRIASIVGTEINRIYDLFKSRNPSFDGGVSLGGHSLGSLILFDLLCHQYSEPEETKEKENDTFTDDLTTKQSTKPSPCKRKMSRRISYMMGAVGTGQPQIHYPLLNFNPKTFFAMGSPIGMFVIVRGLDTLGEKFSLPTCPAFFNIFHPYDPIAYRIESLISPELGKFKPVLIPHHKGRKRMHLELKDTMARVGADLKQKVIDSMKSTWNSFYQLAMFHKQPSLEEEVDKTFQEQLEKQQENEDEPVQEPTNCPLGNLNKGRRVDYVLQEAPYEFINEYIFALYSHVCYWESEDTILLILKEIYSSMGVTSDSQIPQQTMTIERTVPVSNSMNKTHAAVAQMGQMGMDPTLPAGVKDNLQPPPMSGFLRKT